ncbi:MAG TPA: hypothetical protein VF576_01125 [Rubricoccaceae bacterium]|jgi:hypothetical protein
MTPTTARAFLVALATLAPAAAQAQRPARLTVLADTVAVGERVRLAIAVDHGPGRSAVFPDVPAGDPEAGPLLTFGDAEAFSVRRLPPSVRGSVRTDSAVYTVAVFAVDTARVGPVRVRLVAGRDTVDVPTGVALVPVRSELGGEAEPEPAPVGSADPFPGLAPLWAALTLVAALVVAGAVWASRRWRRRPGPAVARLEPYPEATAALDGLGAPVGTPEAAAEQALGAREALRIFLARRLGVPALETTTQEIDAALAHDARVSPEARAATRDVLGLADLVAFAGHVPSPDAASDAVRVARAAVDEIEGAARTPAPPTA